MLVVEDGTGLPNADSYDSVAHCVAYAAAMGKVFPGTDVTMSEQALRRGTAYIDNFYRPRFSGNRRMLRLQSLEWPRYGVVDNSGNYVKSDAVPREIIQATDEAAILELANPGVLMPNLPRGGDIRRLRADTVEVEYGATATALTTFSEIDAILTALLGGVSLITGRAVRG
jgi:hypothetical protein